MWFTSKAELQRENDSKSAWKCFLVLVVLTCSGFNLQCYRGSQCSWMPGNEMGYGQTWSEGESWEKNRQASIKTPNPTQARWNQFFISGFYSWYTANEPTSRLKLEARFHGQLSWCKSSLQWKTMGLDLSQGFSYLSPCPVPAKRQHPLPDIHAVLWTH